MATENRKTTLVFFMTNYIKKTGKCNNTKPAPREVGFVLPGCFKKYPTLASRKTTASNSEPIERD
jgi:hypothetical protein